MQLTAVIVFYQTKLAQALTLQTLKNSITPALRPFLSQIHFVLYDNSPQKQVPTGLDWLPDFDYHHDPRNLGLCPAYNLALKQTQQNNSHFLWLLDQDTALTTEFLEEVQQQLSANPAVQAIVPQIEAAGKLVSPRALTAPFKVVPLAAGQRQNALAINSAALVQVAFLRQIGGFSPEFPLDFLDNWLFYQIAQAGGKVLVLASVLQHQLSVMTTRNIKRPRYHSILTAEWRYYHQYQKIGEGRYRWHLLLRFASQLLLKRDWAKAKAVLKLLVGYRPV